MSRRTCLHKELNWKHHCYSSTHRPSTEWDCKVVHVQLMCNISSCTNLHTGYSSCWVLGISYHIPSMIFKVMEAYEGGHRSSILVYKFEYKTERNGLCVIKVSFSPSRVGFMTERYSETPLFVLTEWDLRNSSFYQSSPLLATYSTILQFTLYHIVYR